MPYKMRNLLATDYLSIKDIFRDEFLGDDVTYRDLRTAWRYKNTDLSLGAVSTANDLIGFTLVRNNYIEYIGTHKHFKGQGLGTRLLKKALSLSSHKKKSMHLYPMSQDQRLIHWYERFGFRKTTGGYMNIHYYNTRSNSNVTS